MDKRIILAVAGAGKTTYIVNNLSLDKRSLIVTYTNNNYNNLSRKIGSKFNGAWPDNICLMTYFEFLYRFCYKPFLADQVKAKGIIFESNPISKMRQSHPNYCITRDKYFYSNRLAFYLEQKDIIGGIIRRIEKYFDELVIDEVQDIAGRDFNFLKLLMNASINMIFVGDFYQHTFDTSRDGNVNKNLFNNYDEYKKIFSNNGFQVDTESLINSWRCSKNVCDFINTNLGITIGSNRNMEDNTSIEYISDQVKRNEIIHDCNIVKLHYQNGPKFGTGHKNWGASKGEDQYQDVCVMLNKTTFKQYSAGKLIELPASTRNKLYVAITRAHGNCYLIEE